MHKYLKKTEMTYAGGGGGAFINIDDSSRNIGIATTGSTPFVGIGTTNPQYKLDVYGDINFKNNLYQDGQLFSGGIGVGSDRVNNQDLELLPIELELVLLM